MPVRMDPSQNTVDKHPIVTLGFHSLLIVNHNSITCKSTGLISTHQELYQWAKAITSIDLHLEPKHIDAYCPNGLGTYYNWQDQSSLPTHLLK